MSGTNNTLKADYVTVIGQQNIIQHGLGEDLKPTTPWNLPNSIDSFTGREEELKILKSVLMNGAKSFISQSIVGLGGVGKTSLAVEYAKRSTDYDFIAFINANSQSSLFAEFKSLAKAFGMSQERIKELSVKKLIDFVYQKFYTQYGKVLLIFDDAIDLRTIRGGSDEKEQANFELLDKYKSTIHWLITTQNQHLPSQIQVIKINVFSIKEARYHIKNRLKNIEQEIMIDELAKQLRYFPLALSYATSYINMNKSNGCDIKKYLELYNKQEKKLLDTDITYELYSKTVYKSWSITMSTLSSTSRKILNYCSFLAPTLIPLSLIESMDEEIDTTDIYDIINELKAYSLIDSADLSENKNTGIILHSLLQTVIRLHLTNSTAEEHYYKLLNIVNKEFQRNTDNHSEDEDRKVDLFTHLTVLIDYVDKNKKFSLATASVEKQNVFADILIKISIDYELLGKDAKKAIKYCERALKMKEEVYGKDSLEIVSALKCLGICECDKDKSKEHFRRAIKIMKRTSPEDIEVFRIQSCLANVLTEEGGEMQLKEAEQLYEEAIEIQKKNQQNFLVLSSSIVNFGILQEKSGNLDKAIELMEEALHLRKTHSFNKQHRRVAAVLNPLARVYIRKKIFDKAKIYAEEAYKINRSCYGDDHEKTKESLNILLEILSDLRHENVKNQRDYDQHFGLTVWHSRTKKTSKFSESTLKAISEYNEPTLDMRNKHLTDDDLIELRSYIQRNSNIKCLLLGHNQITSCGAKLLTELPYIESLSLAYNQLDDSCLLKLAQSQFKSLDLSWNNITDKGIDILMQNSTQNSITVYSLFVSQEKHNELIAILSKRRSCCNNTTLTYKPQCCIM